MPISQARNSKATSNAIKHGYRSGLEEQVAGQLQRAGLPVCYEEKKLRYTKPQKQSTYTPDFTFDCPIVIETKGRFVTEDRQKQLLIKQQHPHLDIRFVFSNSRARISKQSQTTYADWCKKNGFKFADRFVPAEWIEEIRQHQEQQKP